MKEPKDLRLFEILSYSTTRIKCELKNGGISTGTGFFLYINDFEKEHEEPRVILVTNKHVVKDAVNGYLTLSRIIDGKIQNTEHVAIPFSNFETFWHPHSDPDVDLCVLNFNTLETIFKQKRDIEFFIMPLLIKSIPNKEKIENFDAVEDVIMIGYPNGLWDSKNNKPIFRKGITATDYKIDYEGKSEFLIDMAVFGGSSGSPVLIANDGLYTIKGEAFEGVRLHLLGILYAGFQHNANGEIIVVEIPQAQKALVSTNIPNNLGLVIKAEQLFEFRKFFYGPNA